jgi:DNA-binding transcriptional MocR family regulator
MEKVLETHIDSPRCRDYKIMRELLSNHLRHLIMVSGLETGQRLIEDDLAEQSKVSQTPVREAIHRLEIEGLVSYQSRRVGVMGFPTRASQDIDEIYGTCEVREGSRRASWPSTGPTRKSPNSAGCRVCMEPEAPRFALFWRGHSQGGVPTCPNPCRKS